MAADVNDFQIKLVRLEGNFVWHSHTDEDELFLVMRGKMRMAFRRRLMENDKENSNVEWETNNIIVSENEFVVVPKGLEHCPSALTDSCDVLLLERGILINFAT